MAINQIYRCAGYFRDDKVALSGATHLPPPASQVVSLTEEACQYLNDNWKQRSAIHLAAYAMWRVNWIHPFFGGNGRTSRAFSYLVLCAKLGFVPPAAEKNIPELIAENRNPYYDALIAADESFASGTVNVSQMEDLLSRLLAKQLLAVHQLALGS